MSKRASKAHLPDTPGSRILGAGQDRNAGILRNHVDALATTRISIPASSVAFPLVGAVLDPSAGDALRFFLSLAYAFGAAGLVTIDVLVFFGAFTVGGAAPVKGVYYGDGTAPTNAFAGGLSTNRLHAPIQRIVDGLSNILSIDEEVPLPNPMVFGPHVGVAVVVTTPVGVSFTVDGTNAPAGETFMQETL